MNRLSVAWLCLAALSLGLALSGCNARVSTQQTAPATGSSQTAAPIEAAQPEWFSCQQATDCVVEPGVCKEHTAVNQRFLNAFRAYRNSVNARLDCVEPAPDPTHQPVAQCVKNRCALPPDEEP